MSNVLNVMPECSLSPVLPENVTMGHARGAEARAADHKLHGRIAEARACYEEAATLWRAVCDRLDACGEPLIAMSVRGEIAKNERKADACLWEVV